MCVLSTAVDQKSSSQSWEGHQPSFTARSLPLIIGGIASTCYCLHSKHLKNLNLTNLAFYIFNFTPPLIPLMTIALSVSVIGLVIFGVRFQKVTERLQTLLLMTTLMNAGISIFIHECGHAALAALIFRKACPTIHILPFQGGTTSYNVSYGFTTFGKWIGQDLRDTLVTAGGFIASCVFVQIVSKLPSKLFSSTKVRQLLNNAAISQLFFESIHALRAYFTQKNRMENDFTKLWITQGIHPLVPIVINALMLLQFISSKPVQSISELPQQQQSLSR